MTEVPKFNSYDEYAAHVQTLIRDELSELVFSFASDKRAVKILGNRITELDKQITLLQRNLIVK